MLSRPKFHLTEEIINDVLEAIENNGVFIDAEVLDIELPDPKDRVFYEVVAEERKEADAYLVTGNTKHFPKTPIVVTPAEMMEILQRKENS